MRGEDFTKKFEAIRKLAEKLKPLQQKLAVRLKPIQDKISEKLKLEQLKEKIKKEIQNFDPQTATDWVSKTFQKRGAHFYGTMATLVLSTYFVADLTSLLVEGTIPDPPPVRLNTGSVNRSHTVNDYDSIYTRNLFNSQGLIPGEDGNSENPTDSGGPAGKTTLPFTLVGTLVLSDERRSVATIEDKSASMVYPVQVEDEIPGKAKILTVEARRVTFINKTSGRKEYVELPPDANAPNPRVAVGSANSGGGGGGIEKVDATQYNVSRAEVDKALSDMNNILTQARAVPNFENGVAAGYKLFQIVPGSIYDKLGLQNGDVITDFNGQAINDPGKAFQMVEELKKSNHLELKVKKDGRQATTYTYDIH